MSDSAEVYDMSQQNVLIIFTNSPGSTGENRPLHSVIEKDKKNLQETFTNRGFRVVIIRVRNYNDIKSCIMNSSKMNHGDTSCIFIAMLMDCDITSDEYYNIRYLQKLFEKCHYTLLNKPKVLLVNIYKTSGNNTDDDAEMRQQFEEFLEIMQSESVEEGSGDISQNAKTVPSHCDIVVAQWTLEFGPDDGNNVESLWINHICGILNQNPGCEKDILELLTAVNGEMISENRDVEMPISYGTLTKSFNV